MEPLSGIGRFRELQQKAPVGQPKETGTSGEVTGDSALIGAYAKDPFTPMTQFPPGTGVGSVMAGYGSGFAPFSPFPPLPPQMQPAGPEVASEQQVKSMHLGIGARATGRAMASGMMAATSAMMWPMAGLAFQAGCFPSMPIPEPLVTANPNSAVVKEEFPFVTSYFLPNGPQVTRGADKEFRAVALDSEQKYVALKTEVHGDLVTVFNADGSLTTLNTSDLTLGDHPHQGQQGPMLEGSRGPSFEGTSSQAEGKSAQAEGYLIR